MFRLMFAFHQSVGFDVEWKCGLSLVNALSASKLRLKFDNGWSCCKLSPMTDFQGLAEIN